MSKKPTVLMILDGYGLNENAKRCCSGVSEVDL